MFRVNRLAIAPVVAEFLGTGTLVMVALILGQTTAVSYFIATSVALAATVTYMMFNMVSGAHLNPGITFGMWTARRIATLRAIAYIAAQLLGGVVAWQLFQYLTNHQLTARTTTFSTPVWLGEVVGTAILAMAYTSVSKRRDDGLYSGFIIGAAYFTGIVIAATASSGFINPAIALGERAWSAAYVLGPLVGGLIGVNLYAYFFSTGTAGATARPSRLTVRRRSAKAK